MNLTTEQKNTIIHELEIAQEVSSVQEQVLQNIESLIQERVIVDILNRVGKEEEQKIKDLIEDGDQEELTTFFYKSAIDVSAIVESVAKETIIEFKKYKNQ